MIKYLECPDIHKDPERGDIWDIVSKSIIRSAKEQEVDFVAFPGDFWKAVTTNSYKGGVDEALDFFEELTAICPVCAIEGTPSHDSPGSYEILKRAGVIMLEPGKVYGLVKDEISQKSFIERIISEGEHPNMKAILFGVPELNKNNINAKLNLSAEQANAQAVKSFEGYMDSFVAPMRLKYNDIPAFMLFHGNVSDCSKENSSDIIMRASDIVIHSDVFARANLTRVSLGHIHKPWESEKCNMGYTGSPGLRWGERGFIPSMNLLETEKRDTEFYAYHRRLPYGTPERVKVYSLEDIKPDGRAYWLVSDDPKAVLPEGIHPWSRITMNEKNKKSTRRATEEQVEKVKTLWDLALLLNPEIDSLLKPKFDLLQEKNKKEVTEKVDIQLNRIEVYGCKFFSGDSAILDIENINNGLTSIGGEIGGKQNGIGKSGTLSFCSPYPEVVGKDTKSGRNSALKDFFNGQDSRIVKYLTRNGVEHKHVITIKAAHTKSGGKVECNLSINGEPQLDKGTFNEMMDMCESLYGSYQDFLLTSFYVQPLQGKTGSSLMSASMTTIRDLVQGIASIDRSQEKRMAQDEVLKLEKALDGIDIKIKYAEDNLEDKEAVKLSLEELKVEISNLIKEINEGNKKGLAVKGELDELVKAQQVNNNNKTIKDEKESQLYKVRRDIESIPKEIDSRQNSISTIEADKLQVKKYNENKIIVDKYNTELQNYNHYKQNLDSLNNRKATLEIKLENFVIPNEDELQKDIIKYQDDLLKIDSWKTGCQTIKDNNVKKVSDYSKELQDYTIAKNNFDNGIFNIKNSIEIINAEIGSKEDLIIKYDEPCDHCGKISKKAETITKKLRDEIIDLNFTLLAHTENLKELKFSMTEPTKTDPTPLPDYPPVSDNIEENLRLCQNSLSNISILTKQKNDMQKDLALINSEILSIKPVPEPPKHGLTLDPDFIINDLINKIENSKNVEIEINTLQNELKNAEKRVKELEIDINNIIIDTEIDQKVTDKTEEINNLRTIATDLQSKGSGLNQQKINLESKIESIEAEEVKIQAMKDGISNQLKDKDDWQKVADLCSSNKIPALELDIILDSIDMEATRILSPYQDGQYSFRAVTQNDKGTDKFDILIHDSLTGLEKSFLEFSPGVKAILSDAYVKALLKRRSENSYNPTILDESDGPVGPKHIREYYEIQENYFRNFPDKKVLIVSHKTESKAFIENSIEIGDIRQNG